MTCPSCGQLLADGASFCENCGAQVGAAPGAAGSTPGTAATDGPVAPGIDDAGPISTPTAVRTPAVVPPTRACASCGGRIGAEGYCETCGTKAPSERDHFTEAPAAWVAGVCDRGIVHSRNEDAMALWADGEAADTGRAVLVVCDGVSSSTDSDVAALAAARAAREVLRAPMPQGLGVPESIEAAAVKVFTAAAASANAAVVAHTDLASANPASCTFVAATLAPEADGIRLRYAVIGDSRAYWFPDAGDGTQLTTDDSMAQLLMAGGMARADAEASPQAHAITKWLGKDSPDIVPAVGSITVSEPGWLVVCSDGLWNYASEPSALRARLDAAQPPMDLAAALVAFANAAGGRDNITVALARVARRNAGDGSSVPSPSPV